MLSLLHVVSTPWCLYTMLSAIVCSDPFVSLHLTLGAFAAVEPQAVLPEYPQEVSSEA